MQINIGTLVHILDKHYAQVTKPYDDKRTYFSPEIPTELIMIRLKEILEKIEDSGLLDKELPQDIFFKFFKRLYRVYFNKAKLSEKGKGNYEAYQVKTWYPVEWEKDIEDAKAYSAVNVDKWLEVLV